MAERKDTPASQETPAQAQYRLVGLNPTDKEVYIQLLSRSYTLEELKHPAVINALGKLGWPHAEKI